MSSDERNVVCKERGGGVKKKKQKDCISRSRQHSHPLTQLSLMHASWLISYKAPLPPRPPPYL